MTDNEIIKALECCNRDDCDNCPNGFGNCYANLAGDALDLINRQKAEIEQLKHKYDLAVAEREVNVKGFTEQIEKANAEINRLEYTLLGVMHSVDKWLDGGELKQNEVDRAATMREKTLQIVEGLQAEIEMLIAESQMADGYADALEELTKAEAVKEFAERLNEASEDTWIDREGDFIYSDSEKSTYEIYYTLAEWCKDVTDNLVKELTEERAQ